MVVVKHGVEAKVSSDLRPMHTTYNGAYPLSTFCVQGTDDSTDQWLKLRVWNVVTAIDSSHARIDDIAPFGVMHGLDFRNKGRLICFAQYASPEQLLARNTALHSFSV